MKTIRLLAVVLVALVLGGCAAGGMKDVKKTGFINDYTKLKPGGDGNAALVYVDPTVDFSQYDKIMFERVTVMLSPDADYKVIDPALLKELTDYYQNALVNAVKGDYQIVDKPGPGVLRVRVAITGIKPAKPVSNALSTILPVGMVIAGAVKAGSGDNMGTGEAASEMEVLDSVTGRQLAAAVDRRQGGKSVMSGKWDDTKEAFDYWAKRFRARLDELRKGK